MKRSSFKTNCILTLIISIMVVFAGCAQPLKETKNFIWKATRGQNTVYLVATMHLVPKGYKLISDKLESVIGETDGIAVEYNLIDHVNVSKVQREGQSKIVLTGGDIEKMLSNSELEKLKSILSDYNINYDQVKKYSPFGIFSAIDQRIWSIAKCNSPGLDVALLNRYQKDGKRIEELEGVDFQLDMLDKAYTVETLKHYINWYHEGANREQVDEFCKTFEAYINTDLKSIEKLGEWNSEGLNTEEYYNIVLKDRNISMTNKIDKLACSGEVYLVAVGAFHFTGENGIIKKLEEVGYKVEAVN